MRRRDFLKVITGSAAIWPLAARGQRTERVRRIGVLINRRADNPQGHDQLTAFQEALQKLGWNDGGNVRIDICWGENDVDRDRQCATELVALMPDVVLASGTLATIPLQHIRQTLPIVFVQIADPVGSGIVDSLPRPGGNTTGFINYEFSLAGKWVELLTQIAPKVTRRNLRPLPEWWLDRDRARGRIGLPRTDHPTCDAAQAACGLC